MCVDLGLAKKDAVSGCKKIAVKMLFFLNMESLSLSLSQNDCVSCWLCDPSVCVCVCVCVVHTTDSAVRRPRGKGRAVEPRGIDLQGNDASIRDVLLACRSAL